MKPLDQVRWIDLALDWVVPGAMLAGAALGWRAAHSLGGVIAGGYWGFVFGMAASLLAAGLFPRRGEKDDGDAPEPPPPRARGADRIRG